MIQIFLRRKITLIQDVDNLYQPSLKKSQLYFQINSYDNLNINGEAKRLYFMTAQLRQVLDRQDCLLLKRD